jgi:hypothetical protein
MVRSAAHGDPTVALVYWSWPSSCGWARGHEELIMRKADVDLRALTDLVSRIFPPRGRCTIERTESGISTQVYRIRVG